MKIFTYSTRSAKEVLSELDVDQDFGLSLENLSARETKYGLNELSLQKVSAGSIFLRQFKSAFIYLLIGAVILTLLLGNLIDALLIFIFLAINTILGFLQEYRSEKTVQLLHQYALPRATVLRAGVIKHITADHLTVGDIIFLETGDKVPADVRLIETDGLMIDESILTGESGSVYKEAAEMEIAPSSYHQAANLCFSGTNVLKGKAKAVVLAIGKETVFGRLAKLVSESPRVSDFSKGISDFSRFILKLVALTLILVFAAHLIIKPGSISVFDLIIFSVALTISVIPEALPLVTTFSLARGARRLAKRKAIVKRLSAIEDLGGIEVLCSDKTGTLTENKLEVVNVQALDSAMTLYLANLASAFELKKMTEAFDIALNNALPKKFKANLKQAKKIAEEPFDPRVKRNVVLVKDGLNNYLIARGALESILPLCALSETEKEQALAFAKTEGRLGRRTLALAYRSLAENEEGKKITTEMMALPFSFSGVISFQDPIKKTTIKTVQQAEKIGVKIVIITGDGPEVSGAVAHQIGLIEDPDFVITGDEWAQEDEEKQQQLLDTYSVFARVSPEQKFNIIKAFREKYMVGFLGEGINDAPALKVAGVSLVVNSAADIVREASDIILLENDLSVIVDGIKEGRRVFANTTKYIKTTLASNFGNFFAVAAASLLIDYLPMLPIQILLLNLLSDAPMISISIDNVDEKELESPRKYEANEIIVASIILGLISTVFDFLVFSIFFKMPAAVLRTNWFIASILTELVLVFSVRTKSFFLKTIRPSRSIIILSFLVVFITVALPFTTFGQEVFHFTPPRPEHLAIIFGVMVVYFFFTEVAKLFYYRRKKLS
ncbi:cation-transporting P-type ATPase [Candidatus Falkowbacteria bacterium]|jgi:Mg2+-importing ATPase|nr:cation-transporting P-type ATPase [Candidatus Falkowbacteria bacterium]